MKRGFFPFPSAFVFRHYPGCGGFGCADRSAAPPTVKYRTVSHVQLAVHSGNLVTDEIKLLIRLSISFLSDQRASTHGFYKRQEVHNLKAVIFPGYTLLIYRFRTNMPLYHAT